MSILVIGANGLLGSNVVATGTRRDFEITGTVHTSDSELQVPLCQFDIRDVDRFEELLEDVAPTAVVNCAAMTDVDGCETNEGTAQEVNGRAPGNLAEKCAERDTEFVHVSTDYVFDGMSRDPYSETVDPNPIQVYGETKLEGDRGVLDSHDEALITRLSFVYGVHWGRQELTGFPAWVRNRLTSEKEVPLFTDQLITPTRAGHAAEAIFDLLDHGASGIVNVANRSCVTPLEFGKELQKLVPDAEGEITKVKRDTVDRQAERPQYTCLDTGHIETLLSRPEPTLSEDLEQISSYLAR